VRREVLAQKFRKVCICILSIYTVTIFCVKNVNFFEFIRKEWNLGKSIVICTMWMLGWRMKGGNVNSHGLKGGCENYYPSLEIPGQILRVLEGKPWAKGQPNCFRSPGMAKISLLGCSSNARA
jgi:hypothetical protein